MMLVGALSLLLESTNSKFCRQLCSLKLIALTMITYIYKQKVSPLVCDKISVTFKAECSQHASIKNNILQLVEDGYGWPVHRPMYRHSVNIDVAPEGGNAGREMLLVQCDPKISCAFFRCEFNPARADVSLARAFLDQVLASGYKSLILHGVCTRIDLTVDVYGVSIDDLLLWHPLFSKTSAYYKGGQIQTYYLGTPFSPRQFCLYDKVAETKRKNSKLFIPDVLPPSPTTRLEVRIRSNSFVSELLDIGNPFEQLKVGSFGYPFTPANWKVTLFLEACRSRGTQDALLMLPESTRKKFRKIIESSQCAWWSPAKVWKDWPELYKKIAEPKAKTSGVQINNHEVQSCG